MRRWRRLPLLWVLGRVRIRLADPANDFAWSTWEDAEAALAELDARTKEVREAQLPPWMELRVLFAPTGPIGEVALSSGWSGAYLRLASAFDTALWWARVGERVSAPEIRP